jgi:hypothetical protein
VKTAKPSLREGFVLACGEALLPMGKTRLEIFIKKNLNFNDFPIVVDFAGEGTDDGDVKVLTINHAR